jgi:hypothetical protein
MIELSINEKMENLYNIAWKAETKLNNKEIEPTKEEINIIYAITEGILFQGYENIKNGKCSIKSSLDFNIDEIEKEIDNFTKVIINLIQ